MPKGGQDVSSRSGSLLPAHLADRDDDARISGALSAQKKERNACAHAEQHRRGDDVCPLDEQVPFAHRRLDRTAITSTAGISTIFFRSPPNGSIHATGKDTPTCRFLGCGLPPTTPSCPAERNAAATCRPMKPSAPVTKLGGWMPALFPLGGQFRWHHCASKPARCDPDRRISGAVQQTGGIPEANGLEFQMVLVGRYRFQF